MNRHCLHLLTIVFAVATYLGYADMPFYLILLPEMLFLVLYIFNVHNITFHVDIKQIDKEIDKKKGKE